MPEPAGPAPTMITLVMAVPSFTNCPRRDTHDQRVLHGDEQECPKAGALCGVLLGRQGDLLDERDTKPPVKTEPHVSEAGLGRHVE
jgi:hypothetical protein